MPSDPKNHSVRIAIYARYSTDLQREASIGDQQRMCEESLLLSHVLDGESLSRPRNKMPVLPLRSAELSRRRNVDLAECREQPPLVFHGNAYARVPHRDRQLELAGC